jgi:hypothetical protein
VPRRTTSDTFKAIEDAKAI